MTDNTTVSYRVTASHPTHPDIIVHLGCYDNVPCMQDALFSEGYTVTVHRLTTTVEDVTNAR